MVSIVLPIHNNIEFLNRCIDSILGQTCNKWELMIGIYRNPDDVQGVRLPATYIQAKAYTVKDKRIKLHDMYDTMCKFDVLNKLVKHCKYDWVAPLDVNDIWVSRKIENQIPYTVKFDVIGTKCRFFGDINTISNLRVGNVSDHNFLNSIPMVIHGLLIKKTLCNWDITWGVFDILSDYDLLLTLWNQGCKFYNVDNILILHGLYKNMIPKTNIRPKMKELINKHRTLCKCSSSENLISTITPNNNVRLYDFYNDSISNSDLVQIYKNIDCFSESIKDFKKILFICSDYPSYGGAATNCHRLQQFYKKMNHITYAVYYIFNMESTEKIESNKDYKIVNGKDLSYTLTHLSFNPDLVILKSFTSVNIKTIYNCPVYYLIPGIFLDSLDTSYHNIKSVDECNKYINPSVLRQIKHSTKSFCNSQHTKMLLEKFYNIQSELFYSSFVQYHNQIILDDIYFNDRKYNYGLVVSSFDRNIKNIQASINYLSSKTNVLLIGKNSKRYNKPNFTCIESIDHDKMDHYYKQVKVVIQDSYYESCSNVMLEGLFNGCKIFKPSLAKKTTDLLLTNRILIIREYNNGEYDTICAYVDFFKKLDINLTYVLYYNKTLKIHPYYTAITVQDTTKQYQIKNLIDKYINDQLNIVLYDATTPKCFEQLIDIFRNQIQYCIDPINSVVNTIVTIFINFKFSDVPYGGGNQFIMNLVKYLETIPTIKITYELDNSIDIYFIIDIREGPFKRYSFAEIYKHKCKHGGKIVYRINDCDITRQDGELEDMILKHLTNIDHYVFNSTFIRDYYIDKYDAFRNVSYRIIYNAADSKTFYPKKRRVNSKLKIVTHHWSDNINKGYDVYYELNKYCKNRDDMELVIIGRKFADGFIDPPVVIGPYKGIELADRLSNCDIYITASKYDSCPMHLLEGISCGLPVIYLDHPGGVKDICDLSNDAIGEGFKTVAECIKKIEVIKIRYDYYYNNIINNIDLYNSGCYAKYAGLFYSLISA